MDKKLLDFDRRFRRLWKEDNNGCYAVPMQTNHTYEYFIKMSDKLTFGNE
jgi:hypothetical protein